MTNEDRFPTEADAMLLALDRLMEYEAAKASAATPSEEYWAGSAWASVTRDYKAGRARTVRAGR